MEYDIPSKNSDGKMPILDMKVWIEKEEGNIVFQHYEKPMASQKIMHAMSAQSISCKNSVHTQEIIRRLMNSSPLLNWREEVAPVISNYMARMMEAGYPVKYRKDTLDRALRIYDRMVQEDRNGIRPLYRPKEWNVVARRMEKDKKKNSWSTRGGHIAPIFVPPTPSGELARALREIADNEAEAGIHFKIVETGGATVQSMLQKANPTETSGCENLQCVSCQSERGRGGNCRGCGINYQLECQLCPEGSKSVYIGESSRNLFTRGAEHLANYRNRNKNSFIMKHQNNVHQGREAQYTAKVTARTRDCLSRQVREAVLIRRCQVPVLNSKTEWHQPALFRIQNEILRG